MKTKLTKKERGLIPVYVKKWNDKFFHEEFDEEKAKDFVDWLYGLIGKKPPIKIILDSPWTVQLAINMLNPEVTKSRLGSKLGSKLYSELYSELRSKLSWELGSKLDSELGSELGSKLYSELYSKLYSELSSKLYSELYSELNDIKLKYYSFDYYGDTSWFGYLCLYDYVNHVLFPKYTNKIFEKYLELTTTINFLITFEKVAFISKPPAYINFDEKNRLHSTSRAAIEYKDGYKSYYVHGVNFSKELFDKAFIQKNMTSEEILEINNAEQKAIIQEYHRK